MPTTRTRRHLVLPEVSSREVASSRVASSVTVGALERRLHRSRLPAVLGAVGFALGTVIAGLVVASLLDEPVLRSGRLGWGAQASWWTALVSLRDPGVALASMTIGGLPGVLVGRTLAVRRLRRDRLEAWLDDRSA